jgi:hypothetical protein
MNADPKRDRRPPDEPVHSPDDEAETAVPPLDKEPPDGKLPSDADVQAERQP